uniref:cytoskeleton-associated protein 5-like n=1 Tax=Ciona intestinalis TaxID=7719 RepID=UPI00089DAB8D|nr:cytoskeleton-associated protein 5-like [Ciona intestinalis]|eukprot:XP_018670646.1 cytoskeleton-associated protein 5-like [Ciona intestinalis]
MADDDEWKKLPTEQKVQHKSWKARAEGYKECAKKFGPLDEKSPEFSKYLGLVKKFVTDSNELVRIQGLEATLIFVENAAVAGKTCSEVVSGVIAKCFNSKPRLRELGIKVCLMYVEIDRNEVVLEEVLKGFENKQPKVVHACLDLIIAALSEFGSKVIAVKPLLKQGIKLLDHRDKNVREATKSLFMVIYRWIGPAIRTPLQAINSVVVLVFEMVLGFVN